jgi:K+-sensing histidine kinase KdpD
MRHPREEEAGVEVVHRIEEGDPATEIVRVAQETQCELIVLGSPAQSAGWMTWFTGTVPEDLVRKAPCSVLIVKEPVEAESPEPSDQTGDASESAPAPQAAAEPKQPSPTNPTERPKPESPAKKAQPSDPAVAVQP